MQKSTRVAAIQHPPAFLNRDASLKLEVDIANEAADEGADIVVFPETWLPGYPVWLDFSPDVARWDHGGAKELYRLLHENSVEEHHLDPLLEASGRRRITIVMGANERVGKTLYNTIWYCGPSGSILGKHRKLIPTFSERMIWGRGDGSTLSVVETGSGRIGGLICWEHWMPLARAAMHAQNEFVHVALWPFVKEMNQVASRHYAFEGRCFVVACGCVLSQSDVLDGCSRAGGSAAATAVLESMAGANQFLLRGGSSVISPDGSFVAGPVYDRAETLFATISAAQTVEESMAMDTSGHYARPDVFSLRVDTTKQENVVLDSTRGPIPPLENE
jgi:predicted amidohydrolase